MRRLATAKGRGPTSTPRISHQMRAEMARLPECRAMTGSGHETQGMHVELIGAIMRDFVTTHADEAGITSRIRQGVR